MPLPASLANSLELPVVGSPLFIVSGPELVIAQCKAGIVGSFPALNARPVEKLDEWLTRIENELGEYKALHPEKKVAPYAVNQICHASNDRLMKDMEICVKHKVPVIITSLRPPIEVVEAAILWRRGLSRRHQRQACAEGSDKGVDGLILVCAGAGGHAGTLSPFALVPEVKQCFKGTVLISGSISHGRGYSARWPSAPTSPISARASSRPPKPTPTGIQAGHRRLRRRRHRLLEPVYRRARQLSGPSIVAAGLDPANLPESDKTKMNFGSGGNKKVEGRRDIWGSARASARSPTRRRSPNWSND